MGIGLLVGGLVVLLLVWAPWRGDPTAGPSPSGSAATSGTATASPSTPPPSTPSPTTADPTQTTAAPPRTLSPEPEDGEAASIDVVGNFLYAIQEERFADAETYCTSEFLDTIGGASALVPSDDALMFFEVVRAEPAGDSVAVIVDETWESGSWRSTYFVVTWEGPRLIQAAEVGLS